MHRKAAQLVRAAILGSKDALGDLCILCKPTFTGYIYNYLTERNLPLSKAEDLLQDTFESVVKSFHYYDPTASSGSIIPLMRTIVERVCATDAKYKVNRLRTAPMSNISETDEDSADSGWTLTDATVVSAWMAENSPGYVESPLPLQNPRGEGGGRPRRNKPKPKKARARRLSADELQRRERVRQEWAAAGENQAVGMVDAKV